MVPAFNPGESGSSVLATMHLRIKIVHFEKDHYNTPIPHMPRIAQSPRIDFFLIRRGGGGGGGGGDS